MSDTEDIINDGAMEKILKDAELDDFHFIVKFGRKREDIPGE